MLSEIYPWWSLGFDFSQVFQGNDDASTTVSHSLWPVITARFIRIHAVSCADICTVKAEFIGTYEGNIHRSLVYIVDLL